MIGHAAGTSISANFGENQVIAVPVVTLIFERLATQSWLRRQLPA
jgi:hypothetical protein